jgi:outer membrane protein assembly factor BamB
MCGPEDVAGGDVDASPAIGLDGTVIFGSEDGYVYDVSQQGAVQWKFNSNDGVHTAVVGPNGWLYYNGKPAVCAVDGTGKLQWVTHTQGYATIPALGQDGTVYAGTDAGRFYAIQAGTVLWNVAAGVFDAANQPVIGADGTIYIGATTGTFYAFAPDGSTKWHVTTGGAIHGPAAIGVDGTVYFGSADGNLYAVGP